VVHVVKQLYCWFWLPQFGSAPFHRGVMNDIVICVGPVSLKCCDHHNWGYRHSYEGLPQILGRLLHLSIPTVRSWWSLISQGTSWQLLSVMVWCFLESWNGVRTFFLAWNIWSSIFMGQASCCQASWIATLFHSYNKKQQISSTKRCRKTLFSDNIGEFH
jgi:hypothetical protein